MSLSELACVYSALLLVDDNITPTSEKISTVLKAANIEVEPYWPELFANALATVDIKNLIMNAGSRSATLATAAPAAAAVVVADEPVKKEEKKEESDESDDDLGLGLFD